MRRSVALFNPRWLHILAERQHIPSIADDANVLQHPYLPPYQVGPGQRGKRAPNPDSV